MRNWLMIGVIAVAALVAAITRRAAEDPRSAAGVVTEDPRAISPSRSLPNPAGASGRVPARGREEFVGSAVCASCHRAQSDLYQSSHHAKALVAPSRRLEKTRFDGTHFSSKRGGTTRFALRHGAPVVTTPGAGGRTETFSIAYVSGVWPIEQYVVATERGKLQSLGVVWDSRTAAEGGNKWFHVYGGSGIAPTDSLFFMSPSQNWNHMCADCHSTLVERRYDLAADRFDTRWTELSVGCEACHGPGAEHVRAAKAGKPADAAASLAVRLKQSEPWMPGATGSPTPRNQEGVEVEVCAPCHSRREPLKEGFLAGDPFLDHFEPELLLPGRYHADGQVEGEVYEWGSFIQSRMYQAGVTCSDCHNPHSGKPIAEGNALCVRCHEPSRFDRATHSHHGQSARRGASATTIGGARAPLCVDCHMPPATFMQIDERRDHSLRVPRPEHSVKFGTPNACNGCHDDESAAWASDWVAKWFPASDRQPHFVDALAKDRRGAPDGARALRTLVDEAAVPAIARATALERLGQYPGERTLQTLRGALASPEPLVVYGAVLGAQGLPPQQRGPLLLPVLEHRVRAVRIAAARALAGLRLAELPATNRAALERAFAEVEQSFDLSASRAGTHVEQSAFELARGKLSEAEASLKAALRLEPCLAEAHLNLADLGRQRADEPAAERSIRAALACDPKSAAAHHALGLWQVRARKPDAAIESLKNAVDLAPTDPRFAYVLAVAMAGSNRRNEAIRVLDATLRNHPNDTDALQALAGYLREAGHHERAAEVRKRLDSLVRE
jgi:tetratricopeptide (TPR) repeat protein